MDLAILEELIGDLVKADGMLVVLDSGGAVGEMHARDMKEPEFKDGWAMVKSGDWHVHLNMNTVGGVQFVEADDQWHDDIPKLYYVRFSDADGSTLVRLYFPNPWLDEEEKPAEFQPEKLRVFDEFRDRYVGRGGIVFVQRPGEGGDN